MKNPADALAEALNRKLTTDEIRNLDKDVYFLRLSDFEIIETAAKAHLAALSPKPSGGDAFHDYVHRSGNGLVVTTGVFIEDIRKAFEAGRKAALRPAPIDVEAIRTMYFEYCVSKGLQHGYETEQVFDFLAASGHLQMPAPDHITEPGKMLDVEPLAADWIDAYNAAATVLNKYIPHDVAQEHYHGTFDIVVEAWESMKPHIKAHLKTPAPCAETGHAFSPDDTSGKCLRCPHVAPDRSDEVTIYGGTK